MANDFLAPPRIRPKLAAIVATAAVCAVAIIAVASHRPQPPTNGQEQPRSSASSTPASAEPSPTPTPETVIGALLMLVRGTRLVNGIAVGYPHTDVGAVSAAVEYASQVCSTLDPDRSAAIGRAIGDGSPGAQPEDFAEGTVNSRRKLGLPIAGPLPDTASMILGPVAFQLRERSADRVIVLLLAYLTMSSPQAGMRSGLGVFPALLRWNGEDWKLARLTDGVDYKDLSAQPGSLRAAQLGWVEMTR